MFLKTFSFLYYKCLPLTKVKLKSYKQKHTHVSVLFRRHTPEKKQTYKSDKNLFKPFKRLYKENLIKLKISKVPK